MSGRLALAIAVASSVVPSAVMSQTAKPAQLGKVEFATSCQPDAQKRFNEALAYQHSFWYQAAHQRFEGVIASDKTCAIAYWGIALSKMRIPWIPPSPQALAEGSAAVEKGRALGAKSERERDYIEAIAAFYIDHDKVDHRARLQAYLRAVEQLAQKYPDDDEAQIYYALVLNVAAAPDDKTYANQLKAAAILEKMLARRADHPGVPHYLIHSYDYPAIAAKGLSAARRYVEVAPDSPHAQHMPSHIFTRVGLWQDSIASNVKAARFAKINNDPDEQLHFMDYLVYAYLQLGQDQKARAAVDEMLTVHGIKPDFFVGHFALAASPARYMVERHDWKGAAALPVRATPFEFVEAITRFARALGAARSGDPAAARADLAKLAVLKDKLAAKKNAYWAQQVEIQWQAASAWALKAEGKAGEAIQALTAAAALEDRTEKHPVTPGPLAPARELLGEMLLEQGKFKEALAAFEATIQKEPNRLRAYAGAARAAEQAGDKAKARNYHAKVVELAGNADTARPEVVSAKSFEARQ